MVPNGFEDNELTNTLTTSTVSSSSSIFSSPPPPPPPPPIASSWFVFRRFTDFVRLREKLALEFPERIIPQLPDKKWFNKFDHNFLVKRQKHLQQFIDELLQVRSTATKTMTTSATMSTSLNVNGRDGGGGGGAAAAAAEAAAAMAAAVNAEPHDFSRSKALKDFLCLDDPPGPHESLEESKALCEAREEEIYELKEQLKNKDRQIQLLTEQLEMRGRTRKSFLDSFR